MVAVLAGWVLSAVVLGLVIGAAVRLADVREAGDPWHLLSGPTPDHEAPVTAWRRAG